jgi:hypothetical protein
VRDGRMCVGGSLRVSGRLEGAASEAKPRRRPRATTAVVFHDAVEVLQGAPLKPFFIDLSAMDGASATAAAARPSQCAHGH